MLCLAELQPVPSTQNISWTWGFYFKLLGVVEGNRQTEHLSGLIWANSGLLEPQQQFLDQSKDSISEDIGGSTPTSSILSPTRRPFCTYQADTEVNTRSTPRQASCEGPQAGSPLQWCDTMETFREALQAMEA